MCNTGQAMQHFMRDACCRAENVDMMSEYIDLKQFKAIHVVDLCGPLCREVGLRMHACVHACAHTHTVFTINGRSISLEYWIWWSSMDSGAYLSTGTLIQWGSGHMHTQVLV
jgi:hypothetical protein